MAKTQSDAVTFAKTEPLESGNGGLSYPSVSNPPQRDLYPGKVSSPEETPSAITSFSSSVPPISERQASAFDIKVTDPVKETVEGRFPGMKSTFHTYCITTNTTMHTYSRSANSVRRRFRDFVDLSNLLNENYRGYFVPPRPHRSWYRGKFLMQPKFIEERRVLLERYLRALASHPTIVNSDELRVFLECEGKLAESVAWSQLHGINPSIAQGTSKFFRQIIGRERLTPSAAEVTKPASMRKDIVWSFRNSMKNLEDRRRPQLYEGPEFELREERTTLEEFKKDVDAAWKWASYWMDRTEAVSRAMELIAQAFNTLSEYEAAAEYIRIEAPGVIGQGAYKANGVYRHTLQEASNPLSTLYNYSELMRPVLNAMKTREQALNTVQMLEKDLEAKQTRLRHFEIQQGKENKVQQLNADISAVESSLVAARAYYDQVAKNNAEEAQRFKQYRAEDWKEMLVAIADIKHKSSMQLRDIWIEAAKQLGADSQAVSSVQ